MSIPYNQLTTNTLIQGAERAGSAVLGLATIGVLTRLFGVEGFGTYSTIIVFLQFAASLVDFGLGLTLSQLLAEPGADRPRILGNIIPLRILTSCVAFGLSALGASLLHYPPIILAGIAAASGAFIGLQLTQLLAGYFRSLLSMGIVAATEIGQRSLYLILLLLMSHALRTPSTTMLQPALWLASGIQIVAALLLVAIVHKRTRIVLSIDPATLRLIVRRNAALSLSMLATLIYFKADTIILSFYRSAAEVGLYSAPYRILETLVNLPHLSLSLVLPLATAAWQLGDQKKLHSLAQWGWLTTMAIALPMLAGGLFLARPLMIALAGASFAPSGAILQILLVATFAIMIGTQAAYVVLATHNQRRMLPIYCVASVLALGSYILFIPRFGYWAAAWTTLGVESLMAVANIAVAHRILGRSLPLQGTLRIVGATIVMMMFLFLIAGHNVWVMITGGVGIYCISLLLFGFRITPPAMIKKVV